MKSPVVLYSLVGVLPYLILEILAFRRSLRFSRKVTALLTGLFSLLMAVSALFFSQVMNHRQLFLMQNLCSGLFFLLVAKDQIGKKLFTLLMIANDANLVHVLAEHIQQHWLPQSGSYSWPYALLLLALEALVLSPMFVYIRWTCAQSLSGKRRLNAWNYLWLIPLIFYMIWLFSLSAGSGTIASGQFVLVSFMLFLGTVLVYMMVSQLIRENRQKEELQEKEYMLAMQQTQYTHLVDRIEEARRAKHDLRHHLHLVSAYLKDGKLDELSAYLQKYSDTLSTDSPIAYCDHYATNALLNYFASQAKAAGIGYEVSVHVPARMGIPDEALVVVLGNLLENAIAACKEETGTPTIHIYGRTDDSAVFFKMTNPCSHPPKKKSAQPVDALHGQEHGIGLDSVRNIANQYDGIMESSLQDGLFTVSIMLTIPYASA